MFFYLNLFLSVKYKIASIQLSICFVLKLSKSTEGKFWQSWERLPFFLSNISLTQKGDPLEKAIAERLNGIMKMEYLENYDVRTIKDAKPLLKKVVAIYNNERPNMSIGNLTPNQMHQSNISIKTEKL